MSNNVKMILNKIKENGYEAVIVGGCVRDSIMSEMPHDWDIATSAQPAEIMEIFKDFRIMTAGLKHGTVTVIIDHEPYEITTYRIDGKYTDYRRPDTVSYTRSLNEDLLRRDFTINAIAYDGENIIDIHNGIGDIKHRIIRCVGNPDDRFQEDPLRILRALRFAVRFDFQIEECTAIAMKKYMHLLDNIAIERKQSEFSKIICARSVSDTCILKDYKDVLEYVMPEIRNIHNWDETLYEIGGCTELCSKLAILIDASKTDTPSVALGTHMRYPNKVVRSVCNILMCKKELITDSIGCTLHLLSEYPKEDIVKTIHYKLAKLNRIGYVGNKFINLQMILLNLLDIIEEACKDRNGFCYDLKSLDINGHDLKAIGIPDIEISNYLQGLLQLVISNQVENDNEKLIEVVKISRF